MAWDDEEEPVHPYVPETETSKTHKRMILGLAVALVVVLIVIIAILAA